MNEGDELSFKILKRIVLLIGMIMMRRRRRRENHIFIIYISIPSYMIDDKIRIFRRGY